VIILSNKEPYSFLGIIKRYKRYGITKKEMVATSNKKPTKKVVNSLKIPLSISGKFQNKKLILTKNERSKNRTTKAFSNLKRDGKNVIDINFIFISAEKYNKILKKNQNSFLALA
tara:strand:+ start:4211 stop:4555 length:345 start_codon:yes stop_codon:yes gene_type:complete